MTRILIADDHAIVRKGIRHILIEGFPDAIIEEVADAESLIKQTLEKDWEVIISDLSMPGRSGLDALPQIKQIKPKIPILVMSIHPEEHYAVRVLRAGGSGYVSKDLAPEELVTAVKRVLSGKKYITPQVAEKLASHFEKDDQSSYNTLSDREFSVLKLLASGKSLSEIAEMMYLSVNTISTYRGRILTKLGMKTNADLTLYCLENKLI